jgi:hypothetical protein
MIAIETSLATEGHTNPVLILKVIPDETVIAIFSVAMLVYIAGRGIPCLKVHRERCLLGDGDVEDTLIHIHAYALQDFGGSYTFKELETPVDSP